MLRSGAAKDVDHAGVELRVMLPVLRGGKGAGIMPLGAGLIEAAVVVGDEVAVYHPQPGPAGDDSGPGGVEVSLGTAGSVVCGNMVASTEDQSCQRPVDAEVVARGRGNVVGGSSVFQQPLDEDSVPAARAKSAGQP